MANNTNTRKVLVLCDAFPPAFAPRMGYLCKYLKNSNWQPTVLTEAVPGNMFAFLADVCPATFISFYTRKGKWSSKFEWITKFLFDFFFGYKDNCMIKEGERLLKQQKFDLILCSTYRTFPLPAAQKLAERHHIPLVVDTRDMIEQYPRYEFMDHQLPTVLGIDKLIASVFRRKLLKQRNKTLCAASYLTTISPWHANLLKQYNQKVELIYNGFDPEIFYPVPVSSPQFNIIYTGRLISIATRNPVLLFKALKILSAEKIFSPTECRVVWYVDNDSEATIRQEAEKYGVSDFMDYHCMVSATEIPNLLNQSSVLLSLTNKLTQNGPKGFMTTKFFESLAVEKPILCIQSDEDCLEAAINEANAGLAGRNVEEVCQFLRDTYRQWKEQGFTSANVRREVLSKYSRKEQAAQFVRIFNSVITETI